MGADADVLHAFFQRVADAFCNCFGPLLLAVEARDHRGIGRAREHRKHMGALGGKLGPHALGRGPHSGLARRIGAAEGRVHPRHFGEDVGQRAAAVSRQHRGEGPRHVQIAPVIDLEHGACGREGGRAHHAFPGDDGGIVDHQRDARALLGSTLDGRFVGHVEGERLYTRALRKRRLRKRSGQVGGVDAPGAALRQRRHQAGADATGGAGDEGLASLDTHRLSRSW